MITNNVGKVCVARLVLLASVMMMAAEGYYVQVAQRMQGLY